MAFCILPSITLLSMHLLCFLHAHSPDAAVPLEPDLRGKVKASFTLLDYDGWLYWVEKEVQYRVFVQRATWLEAERICKQHNAHLSSVSSDEESHVIYGLAKTRDARKYTELLWIGGRQKNYPWNKAWLWADGKPFSYTRWDKDEPSNDNDDEHCLAMYNGLTLFPGHLYDTYPEYWNDASCDTNMRAFVCKRSENSRL